MAAGASSSAETLEKMLDALDPRAAVSCATFKPILLELARTLPVGGNASRISESPHGRGVEYYPLLQGGTTGSNKGIDNLIHALPDDPRCLVSTRTFKRIGIMLTQALAMGGNVVRVQESPNGRVIGVGNGGATGSHSTRAERTLRTIGKGFLGGATLRSFAREIAAAAPVAGLNARVTESPHGRSVNLPAPPCNPARVGFLLIDPFDPEVPYEVGMELEFSVSSVTGDLPVTLKWYINGVLMDESEYDPDEDEEDPEAEPFFYTIAAGDMGEDNSIEISVTASNHCTSEECPGEGEEEDPDCVLPFTRSTTITPEEP